MRGKKTMEFTVQHKHSPCDRLPRTFFALIILFVVVPSLRAQITIENAILRLGRYQTAVANDGGSSSITAPGWTLHPGEGFWEKSIDPLSYLSIDHSVCTNWTDPDGKVWKYMIVAPNQEGSNIKFPL